MTRKQRAAKLARRRDAQAQHRGKVRIEDHGRSKIQVPVGPQPARGFRRTDPYEHGEELRKREQIVSFCARIGFDPLDHQIQTMRTLLDEGKLTERVITTMASREQAQQAFDVATEVVYGMESESRTMTSLETIAKVQEDGRTLYMDPEHVDEIDGLSPKMEAEAGSLMTHEELEQDAWDQAAYEQRMGWPTPAQWAELETAAKAKKKGARGYVRVLQEAGFVLGKNEDPKDRKSWVRT